MSPFGLLDPAIKKNQRSCRLPSCWLPSRAPLLVSYTHTHTHIYTHIYTYTRAHTNVHTQTHTFSPFSPFFRPLFLSPFPLSLSLPILTPPPLTWWSCSVTPLSKRRLSSSPPNAGALPSDCKTKKKGTTRSASADRSSQHLLTSGGGSGAGGYRSGGDRFRNRRERRRQRIHRRCSVVNWKEREREREREREGDGSVSKNRLCVPFVLRMLGLVEGGRERGCVCVSVCMCVCVCFLGGKRREVCV